MARAKPPHPLSFSRREKDFPRPFFPSSFPSRPSLLAGGIAIFSSLLLEEVSAIFSPILRGKSYHNVFPLLKKRTPIFLSPSNRSCYYFSPSPDRRGAGVRWFQNHPKNYFKTLYLSQTYPPSSVWQEISSRGILADAGSFANDGPSPPAMTG